MVVNLVFFPIALQVLPASPYLVQAVFMFGVVIVSYLGHSTSASRCPDTPRPGQMAMADPDTPKADERCPSSASSPPATTRRRTSRSFYRQVRDGHRGLPPRDGEPYTYEHIFIDNASTDRTVEILRGICATRPARQGHRQHPQLRPHPLAVPRAAPGAGRRGDQHRRRPAGPAGDDPRVRRQVGGGVQGRRRRQAGEPGEAADVLRAAACSTASSTASARCR